METMSQKTVDLLHNKKISPIVEDSAEPNPMLMVGSTRPALLDAAARVLPGCPLCRRRNTVRLLSQESNRLAKLACSYDGCRGYEWEQNI